MSRWEPDARQRLILAALQLFDERGYEATTVADIAEAVGLTKRTFFRYFADKREVLFNGAAELQEHWINGIVGAAAEASALTAVSVGLDDVVRLFADRHPFARVRSAVIAANPELQERELIKLQSLTAAIAETLIRRGEPESAATLAAHAGVTVFHVAFGQWVAQDDPTAFRPLMDTAFHELGTVTAELRMAPGGC